MNRPLESAQQFGWACLLGLGLGLFYGFLRPVRPRFLADLLFLPALFYAWIRLSFQICRGDIRMGITLGLFVGFLAWELTLGRLLKPVFSALWRIPIRLLHRIASVFGKFFKKIWNFPKFFLASRKK